MTDSKEFTITQPTKDWVIDSRFSEVGDKFYKGSTVFSLRRNHCYVKISTPSDSISTDDGNNAIVPDIGEFKAHDGTVRLKDLLRIPGDISLVLREEEELESPHDLVLKRISINDDGLLVFHMEKFDD